MVLIHMQKKYGHPCHQMEYANVTHCKIKILMRSKSLKSFVIVRCFQDPLFHMVESCASLSKKEAKSNKYYGESKFTIVRISLFIKSTSENMSSPEVEFHIMPNI